MALGACACKKKKPKPFPPAPQLVSTATTAAAAVSASADAGLAVATPAPATSGVTAAGSADRAALEQAKASVAELETMVKKGVTTNPDKPEGGDATAKCTDLEASRAQLEGLADPEGKKVAAEVKRLCSFEVPIVSADLALKQVTISPSQASRKLICGFASKDIEKARGVKASDRRVRDLETRFAKACHDALAR
jgi:hypothetical protein